jgi:hypothetical protein
MPQTISRLADSSTAPYRAAVILAVAAATTIAAAPKFVNVWKAPDAARLNFIGKKVAALVITDDQSLQMSAEEALSRELTARKVLGVASYRMLPREEMKNADTARGWYERAAVQGVVALRPVSVHQEQAASPVVWTSGYYPSFWGYYGYGWSSVYVVPLSARKTTTFVVETLIYDLPRDRLVWAGLSETRNPSELQSFIKELVAAAVDEMKKNKLVG